MNLKMQDVFHSGTHENLGDREVIKELDFLVTHDYLKVIPIPLGTKEEYLSKIDTVSDFSTDSYNAEGGGIAHVALKHLSAEYLKSERNLTAAFEHYFCGYYPDVISLDTTIVIECGNTQNPEKILKYFCSGNAHECIQIPYPYEDDEFITGYRFIPHNQLCPFVKEYEQSRRNDLKKIALRKRV